MTRAKSRPERKTPSVDQVRSDTGRMHKPKPMGHVRYPERWNDYHANPLTPWSLQGDMPFGGSLAARRTEAATRAWQQVHPLPLHVHVPSLSTLARGRIPGLYRYSVFGADGSFQR